MADVEAVIGSATDDRVIRVGLISDTHGLLRKEAIAALAGVDHIVHAGDIGHPDVICKLEAIASLTAVRGNNDTAPWAAAIPLDATLELATRRIYVLHDIKTLDREPRTEGYDVVIAGHSHRPSVTERDGVLFVNPGSAGPRRFSLPVCVGFLEVGPERVAARIQPLL